jgi:AraC-like DNA-binding protein
MDKRARNMNVSARHTAAAPVFPSSAALYAALSNAMHAPYTFRLLHATHFVNTSASGWASGVRHAAWLLEMYQAGELEVRVSPIGRRVMRARRGLLLPPMTQYFERPVGGSIPARSMFIVFEELSGDIPKGLGLDPARPYWIEDARDDLQPLLERLIAAVHGRGWMAWTATALFHQILASIASANRRGRNTLSIESLADAPPDFIVAANEYMRAHMTDAVTIPDIAAAVGLSASGFSHAYRRATGRSPMTALRTLRVEAAKLHMIRGRLKLEAIAQQTGFADAFHLSRVFKRFTGASPREFLRGRRAFPQA